MTELSPLKQFVPSAVCLKCDGCCRFQSSDSAWRPKWNKKEFTDDENFVTTIAECGNHLCRFFNKTDSTCRTYADRPFDCALYPFLLSDEPDGLKVYVHLACPYIQDHETDPALNEYVDYLRAFFNEPATADFLRRNKQYVQDYVPQAPEIRHLFTLERKDALLEHKPLFEEFAARSPRPLSTYHFSSIFAWQDFFQFRFELIDDRLCVFAHQGGGSFLYLPPLGGDIRQSTLQECWRRMGPSPLARVENISDIHLPGLREHGYNAYLKAHEYVYARRDLVELGGHAYKSKRHDIHLFLERHPHPEFREYAPGDFDACSRLYRRWAQDRKAHCADEIYVSMLEENARVHRLLLRHYKELGLAGRVLICDEELIGYSFGYALDEQTFCVLLEITDLEKTGAAAHIFHQFCADPLLGRFEHINTMDDFGMPQVARTKESYRPLRKLPVYTLTKRDNT